MNMTTTFIRRHIFALPLDSIFTTRHFLSYGKRAAVDQALSRLVRCGVIIRLARGVFVKEGSRTPSPLRVATTKAQAFGKRIAVHASTLACELGLAAAPTETNTFSVQGSSSSFRFGCLTIYLKHTGPRKMALSDNKAGLLLKALWHLGSAGVGSGQVMTASLNLGRQERIEVRQSACLLPAWLSSYFVH